MAPDEPDHLEKMELAMVRAAMRAIHEAHGIITTRCQDVNRVLYEYPDGDLGAVDALLAIHDRGECTCRVAHLTP